MIENRVTEKRVDDKSQIEHVSENEDRQNDNKIAWEFVCKSAHLLYVSYFAKSIPTANNGNHARTNKTELIKNSKIFVNVSSCMYFPKANAIANGTAM